jgi:hypothetical protein
MRRKRLQHVVDTLCHMFCGWRLANSFPALDGLGDGTLTVDVLSEACTHNGRQIQTLTIAGELNVWLLDDLRAHRIDLRFMREVTLIADLTFSKLPRTRRQTATRYALPPGQHRAPSTFIACDIRCRSRVLADEVLYESAYVDREEWPLGWPNGLPLPAETP